MSVKKTSINGKQPKLGCCAKKYYQPHMPAEKYWTRVNHASAIWFIKKKHHLIAMVFSFNNQLNRNDDGDKHDSEWANKRTTCFITQQAINLTYGNFIQDIANSLILIYKQAELPLTFCKK